MIKKYLLFGYLSLLFFGFSLLVEASSTEVQSITPNTGNSITYTKVKINGSGFTPIPKVALYGGGPYIIGSCNTQGQAQDVYVKGSYAYVANFQGGPQVTVGLQVIDISDPNIPSIVGSCYLPVKPNAVYVDGLYAYVTAWDDPGLHVIDISDPTNPNIVGSCDT